VIVADGLLELDGAADRRVLGEVLIQGINGGVLNVVGRREIRLARAEVDDVYAFAALTIRLRGHLHGGRFTDPRNSFG